MIKKPTYAELEQRVKELENISVTYDQAKETLKESMDKSEESMDSADINMATEMLENKNKSHKPLEQAFVAEHFFRKSIENAMPCGIVGVDLDGRQIYVNRVFTEMVGYSEEELIGEIYPFVYWPAELIKEMEKKFKKILCGNISSEGIELLFQTKEGVRFWGLVLNAPLIDSQGKTVGRLMSVANINFRKQAQEKLRILSSRLINAQEKERRHVSQDLHDSIGGRLAGIKYSLENILSSNVDINNKNLENALSDVVDLVKNSIEETQRISKNLHPSILDDLGLMSALRDFSREFIKIYTNIQIKTEITVNDNQIPDKLKILIYRVYQEAFNNVAKHSDATLVRVALKKVRKEIRLQIQDNGKGFDLVDILNDTERRSLGIESMRERTELFNGSFRLESKPNKGTHIRAVWPII